MTVRNAAVMAENDPGHGLEHAPEGCLLQLQLCPGLQCSGQLGAGAECGVCRPILEGHIQHSTGSLSPSLGHRVAHQIRRGGRFLSPTGDTPGQETQFASFSARRRGCSHLLSCSCIHAKSQNRLLLQYQ